MATINDIKELAFHVARGTAPANFTNDNVREAYAAEVEALCGSINQFQKNKYDLYQIIIEVADEIVPKKAIDVLGQFAEIKNVPQGQKVMFKRKLGRNRAKKFLTQVGVSGVYETFRLDSDVFTINAHAIGGAVSIDFERFLDGAENLNELMDIVTEGLEEAVYLEVQKALKAAISSTAGGKSMPSRNKLIYAGFNAAEAQKVIGTVKAYGSDAVIFATPEFVEAMGPDAIVAPIAGAAQGIYHPADIDAIHNVGRVKIFRGTPIVEIPQSFVDETNTQVYIDPRYAYVLPTGGEKVVKVVFEGATQIYDAVNRDQSIEVNIYKRLGVGILTLHNWGVIVNTSIAYTNSNPSTIATATPANLSMGNPYGRGIAE